MPTLEEKLWSKHCRITVLDSKKIKADECQLGLQGSPTQVNKVFAPERRTAGEMIRANPKEAAEALHKALRELKVIGYD